jgi:putative tributyrin esterase
VPRRFPETANRKTLIFTPLMLTHEEPPSPTGRFSAMIAAFMRSNRHRRSGSVFLAAILLLSTSCRKEDAATDHPRLTPNVVLRDITFHSAALNRDMPYRVVLPADLAAGRKMPVVYLLHGGGGGFRDWTNYSDVARFAEPGMILVMPEGAASYYTNAVDPPQDRYEDFIVNDLISDVESKLPVATGRSNRAIIGLSMGGFGAVKLALRHPDLFVFAGGLSSAIDVPRRPFSIKRLQQSRHYNAIFGSFGSSTRRDNDPFLLVRIANPETVPYFFLTCGEQEGLLPANREFAAALSARHFRFEFHTVRGSHDWNQWNAWLPSLFRSLAEHMNTKELAIQKQP